MYLGAESGETDIKTVVFGVSPLGFTFACGSLTVLPHPHSPSVFITCTHMAFPAHISALAFSGPPYLVFSSPFFIEPSVLLKSHLVVSLVGLFYMVQ